MNITVFVGMSLDGYIADQNGGLEFLESVPNPEGEDLGFRPLMERVDAVIMGRKTFEAVLGLGCPWPYEKPVFVLSDTLNHLPAELNGKAEIVSGSPAEVLAALCDRGHERFYVDGGKVIQSFLSKDLVDELVLTRLPMLLGGGTPLFGALRKPLHFQLVENKVLLDAMVQSHYRRKRA